MNNNIPQSIIEIEITAEKVYYTIIGQKKDMKILIDDINKKNIRTNITYIISKLIVPLANIVDNDIILAPSTEQIQCSVLCDCNINEEKEAYALLCLIKIEDNNNNKSRKILKFPEIDLKDNFEPEKSIIQEIKTIATNIPNPIKNTIRLVDITGSESDILVYTARIGTTPKKYIKRKIINK